MNRRVKRGYHVNGGEYTETGAHRAMHNPGGFFRGNRTVEGTMNNLNRAFEDVESVDVSSYQQKHRAALMADPHDPGALTLFRRLYNAIEEGKGTQGE